MSSSNKKTKKNKTVKNKKIQGDIDFEKSGWKHITVYGEPYDRGYAHGNLLSEDLKRVLTVLPFMVDEHFKISFKKYMDDCNKHIYNIVKKKCPEIYSELRGIVAGARKKGVNVTLRFLIAWNSFLSLYSFYKDGGSERCSAFIATGEATEKGDIVMAHNTHSDFLTGQLLNIVMTIKPANGNIFKMQTSAGFVASSSDWFLCENGIVGCETTIAHINFKPKFGLPYFCRIRKLMQYANNLDDCIDIMSKDSAGDYSCSWLYGNTNDGEIMVHEIGKNIQNVKRMNNGVIYGMNSALSFEIRNLETTDTDHSNLSTSLGSRSHRLDYLLNQKHYGKINLSIAKEIIADHYDTKENRIHKSARGICKHSEIDDMYNFTPYGATDGKVVNSDLAKTLNFHGRFGSSCGRAFSITSYVKKHPEHKKWLPVLDDYKPYGWVKL